MTRFFAVMLTVFFVGCDSKFPDAPTPLPDGNGGGNGNLCRTSSERKELLDENDGPTGMWVQLQEGSLNPSCGSKIVVGQQSCADPKNCFQAVWVVGFDSVDNRHEDRVFEFSFSQDGKTPTGELLRTTTVLNGGTAEVRMGPRIFPFAPLYMLVRGSKWLEAVGSTSVWLGYH